MNREGPKKYTPEELDVILAAYDTDLTLGNHPNEPTRGEWMMLRNGLAGVSGEEFKYDTQNGVVFLPDAAAGSYPAREA